nr:zinc finger, CCHC-type [Tanacetum cinerariifolium]
MVEGDKHDNTSSSASVQEQHDNTSSSASVQEQGNISLQCPKLTETNYTTWALLMETILKAHGLWKTIDTEDTVDEKKAHTSKAMIFQTLPEDVLMQKARSQTLRSELESLKMKERETISGFASKLSSIRAKFRNLGTTLESKIFVRKLLNSVPKKFLPIVATIEQYQNLDEMSFEEAVGRLTAFEERIKSEDTLEANDQDKLLMASSNYQSHGKGQGENFNKEAKENMKWKNSPNARGTSMNQGTKNKSTFRYYECSDFDHFARECTKWKYNKDKQEESYLIYETDNEPTLL